MEVQEGGWRYGLRIDLVTRLYMVSMWLVPPVKVRVRDRLGASVGPQVAVPLGGWPREAQSRTGGHPSCGIQAHSPKSESRTASRLKLGYGFGNTAAQVSAVTSHPNPDPNAPCLSGSPLLQHVRYHSPR